MTDPKEDYDFTISESLYREASLRESAALAEAASERAILSIIGGKASFPPIDVALRELQREAREQYETHCQEPKPISSDYEAGLKPKKI